MPPAALVVLILGAALGGAEAAMPVAAGADAAVLRPDGTGGSWDGDRMRGARERPKDVLPGRPG